MSKSYFVNGRLSETPAYWTAHYSDIVIDQINDAGEISKKWSLLDADGLEYWGVVTNIGCYGFYPKDSVLNMNGTTIPLEVDNHELYFSRKIIASSDGWEVTKSITIGLGDARIDVVFLPKTEVMVYEHKK